MSDATMHLPRPRKRVLTKGHVRCLITLGVLVADGLVVWLVRFAVG
jgi:hypothetical protein